MRHCALCVSDLSRNFSYIYADVQNPPNPPRGQCFSTHGAYWSTAPRCNARCIPPPATLFSHQMHLWSETSNKLTVLCSRLLCRDSRGFSVSKLHHAHGNIWRIFKYVRRIPSVTDRMHRTLAILETQSKHTTFGRGPTFYWHGLLSAAFPITPTAKSLSLYTSSKRPEKTIQKTGAR